MSAVRAKYQNGVLTPLEPLDLAEGAEVMVSVEDAPVATPEDKSTAQERPEVNGALGGSFNIEALVALQEEAFGDKILPEDGADFIRKARQVIHADQCSQRPAALG